MPVLDLDDLVVLADAGAAEPSRHGAVGPPEPGEPHRVQVNLADVHDEHLARLRPLNVCATAGRVAGAQLVLKLFPVGVALQPRAPVDLGLDLELLARLHVQGRLVVWAGLEVQNVFGCAFHLRSSLTMKVPLASQLCRIPECFTPDVTLNPWAAQDKLREGSGAGWADVDTRRNPALV